MDPGLAALLGASVGVVGTVAASAISGWSTRQQLAAQARVDYAQWRRQGRRDAYSAFLAPASEARNALKLAQRAFIGERDAQEVDLQLRAAQTQLNLLQAAWASPSIEGPRPVEQTANGVRMALQSMQATLLAWQAAPPDAPDGNVAFVERHAVEASTLSERMGAFTSAAHQALDDVLVHRSGNT